MWFTTSSSPCYEVRLPLSRDCDRKYVQLRAEGNTCRVTLKKAIKNDT